MTDQTLDEGAVVVHEFFLAYIKAGFKRSEALDLIKVHLAKIIDPEPKGDDT